MEKILYNLLGACLAAVWLTALIFLGYRGVNRYVYRLDYAEFVYEYADYYDLSRALVFAVIKTESGFNERAKSQANALGLMQITEETGKYIAEMLNEKEYDLLNAKTNVRFGCRYLRYLSDRFADMNTVVCAYNAGEGNVRAWLSNLEYSEDGVTLKSVPFKETREYAQKIFKSFEKYEKIYGKLLDKKQKFS